MDLNYRGSGSNQPSLSADVNSSSTRPKSSSSSNSNSGSTGVGHAYLIKAEEIAEEVHSKSKKVLPSVGRFLLISTFFEDGFRMWFQWEDQTEYFRRQWGVSLWVVSVFLLLNMVAQLSGSVMILLRKRVDVAVGILFGVIVTQVPIFDLST